MPNQCRDQFLRQPGPNQTQRFPGDSSISLLSEHHLSQATATVVVSSSSSSSRYPAAGLDDLITLFHLVVVVVISFDCHLDDHGLVLTVVAACWPVLSHCLLLVLG